ncbi:MAG: hypothetical protein ACREJM_05200 [Candidatus Saccharimonadales bacterium]
MAAMFSLHDFDVRSRGIADVVEVWNSQETAVQTIWKPADLIAASMDLVNAADQIRDRVRLNGSHCDAVEVVVPIYFHGLLQRLKGALTAIEGRVGAQGLSMNQRTDLRQAVELLSEILADLARSAEAADWEQLNREALTTQELLDVRAYLRESGQASM